MAEMQVQQIRADALRAAAALVGVDRFPRAILDKDENGDLVPTPHFRAFARRIENYIVNGVWT